MHCLVTGAGGYIGRGLVPALIGAGWHVTATCWRRPVPEGVHHSVRCDLADPDGHEALRPVMGGVDTVFHLAGIAHQLASAADYCRVNVDGSVALARMAVAAGVKRFVYLSSVKALDAPPLASLGSGALDYAGSKALAEAELKSACDGAATDLVLVRPALVYGGEESGHLHLLRRWVQWRLPRPPAGGCLSMISRDDLVEVLEAIGEYEGSPPGVVTVTDGERYTTRRLHEAFCCAAGRKPLLPSPPGALWQLASNLRDRVHGEPSGSTWHRLTGDSCVPATGMDTLSVTPRLDFENSLASR